MSGVKVTNERPARAIPAVESVAGDVDDEDVDWEPDATTGIPPGGDPGDVLTWDGDSWEPEAGVTIPDHTYELANEGGDPLVKPHGATGTTETIDPTDGNVHTLTLDDDSTWTIGSPAGAAAELVVWVTNSGVHTLAWSGSVTEFGTRDTTDGLTNRAVLSTVNGGTSWVVDWIGGGTSVGALDDLTDVTITAPAEGDTLRYVGAEWVNDNRRWEPVTDGEDVFVWDGDDLVFEWRAY